jgi:CubicO group peptidase (beta-lactamase class C family)
VDAATTAQFAALVEWTQETLAQNDVPGVSIAVILGGKLAFAAGVGVKGPGRTEPVTTSTRFLINSMTKALVAAGVMAEVDRGHIDVRRPVTDFVGFQLATPFDPSSMTVHEVLTHTAGLPDGGEWHCETGKDGLEHAWENRPPYPLWAPPGAVWDYSNVGYSLAGRILEQSSGLAFAEALAERVFAPAGMAAATLDPVVVESSDHATGHSPTRHGDDPPDGAEPADELGCDFMAPAGGVYATASDYAHFAEMLLAGGGKALTSSSVAAMTAKHVDTRQDIGFYGLWAFYSRLQGREDGGTRRRRRRVLELFPDRAGEGIRRRGALELRHVRSLGDRGTRDRLVPRSSRGIAASHHDADEHVGGPSSERTSTRPPEG